MSWSVTFNDLRERDSPSLPEATLEYLGSQHPEYLNDLAKAFALAKELDLASAVLTGMRTPNPYGGDEVLDISVRGMIAAPDFNAEMKRIVQAGPDDNAQ